MDLKRHLRVRGQVALAAGLALAAALGSLLIFAYTSEQDDVNNVAVATRWANNSMTWSLNATVPSNVHTTGGDSTATVITKAFGTWQNAALNGQAVVNLTITQGSNSTLTTVNGSDCINVVSFVDSTSNDFPTGTIAFAAVSTSYGTPPNNNYSCTTPPTTRSCPLQSCIVDVEIMFSPKQQFSTTTPPLSGDFDVQAVATHEVGHALGLDHSGIGAAVMYPFGDTGQSQSRVLSADDAAGMASIYPNSSFAANTGTISGQVTMNGTGIFASHVIAIDTATGDAVIDGLTDTSGNYKLIGLPPGTYNVLALPLAPDTNSGIYTLTDFGGWSCGYAGTAENSPPCCDPAMSTCTGKPESNPTNYTGKFF